MMSEYNKLLELVEDDKVKFGISLPEHLHKKLVLGQTRHVCRYGTLSDGHEKITPAQRYFQAIKEIYYLASNVEDQRASAMEAQADKLDAEDALKLAKTEAEKMRAEARLLRAKRRLISSLVTVEDQLRMIDEYNKIRLELEPEVEARYPGGIEEAEADNWEAVALYRLEKEQTQGLARERLDNVPLSPEHKAMIGYAAGRFDAIAPLKVSDEKRCREIAQGFERKLVELKSQGAS